MFKLIKYTINLLPWYLRPTYVIEIVPDLIKENNNSNTNQNNPKTFGSDKSEVSKKNEIDIYKIGFEEIVYGLGVVVFLTMITSSF